MLRPYTRHTAPDAEDDPFCDFYTGGAHLYPKAEDVYLMFPSAFRHFSPPAALVPVPAGQ
jgi:hypothetical protein